MGRALASSVIISSAVLAMALLIVPLARNQPWLKLSNCTMGKQGVFTLSQVTINTGTNTVLKFTSDAYTSQFGTGCASAANTSYGLAAASLSFLIIGTVATGIILYKGGHPNPLVKSSGPVFMSLAFILTMATILSFSNSDCIQQFNASNNCMAKTFLSGSECLVAGLFFNFASIVAMCLYMPPSSKNYEFTNDQGAI
eukprot:TRINITY_DN1129_c0_g1_i1.p1 TRINITY_DN1129_c0_g1~~TRINITY_DN1129_c0_g1_i1.p1  ORF type:complete len:198 (+),score=40.97 TRINITY_DN1129_c0_g1_i1:64-657(+)